MHVGEVADDEAVVRFVEAVDRHHWVGQLEGAGLFKPLVAPLRAQRWRHGRSSGEASEKWTSRHTGPVFEMRHTSYDSHAASSDHG